MAIIDRANYDKKMKAFQEGLNKLLLNLHKDAASYLQMKIVDDVLDGPEGTIYPKTGYASGISEGQTGFVGIVSGNLKSSIQAINEKYQSQVVVDPSIAPVADYYKEVAAWSEEKYGKNYMEIAFELYSEFLNQKMYEEVIRFLTAVNQRTNYTYQNPFPA